MDTLGKSWAPIIGAGIGSGTSLSVTQGKRFNVISMSAGSATASHITLLAGTTPIARLYVPAAGSVQTRIGKLCEKDEALQIYGAGAVTYLTITYDESDGY